MGKTSIEWTDETWNPLTGCTKVSPGCDHCYAKLMHERFNGPGSFDTVTLHPERLDVPLSWRKPRKVFVNSMSDLFEASVPDDYIARVFATMSSAGAHTFQVLTKRHARMKALLNDAEFQAEVHEHAVTLLSQGPSRAQNWPGTWPLPNVWLGVSVENQQWADIRIPALLDTPAAVWFLSCEPLLGHVALKAHWLRPTFPGPSISWVIVGGESGPGARPMHPDWARALRDQCTAASVPFLFKQWGAWAPDGHWGAGVCPPNRVYAKPLPEYKPERMHEIEGYSLTRMSKHAAGRLLDGRLHDGYPESVA